MYARSLGCLIQTCPIRVDLSLFAVLLLLFCEILVVECGLEGNDCELVLVCSERFVCGLLEVKLHHISTVVVVAELPIGNCDGGSVAHSTRVGCLV